MSPTQPVGLFAFCGPHRQRRDLLLGQTILIIMMPDLLRAIAVPIYGNAINLGQFTFFS
jgi:hypothetical protein